MTDAYRQSPSSWGPIALVLLAVATLTIFNISTATGSSLGMGIFLSAWFAVLALRPTLLIDHLRGWLVWPLPLLCLLSTAWSRYPSVTLKNAVELLVFVAATMTMAKVVGQRWLVFAMMVAWTVVIGASLAVEIGEVPSALRGTHSLIGIYASKNALVINCALLTISALIVSLSRGLPAIVRVASFPVMFLGIGVAVLGHSLGGLVAMFAAMMLILIISAASKLPLSLRFLAVALLGAVALAGVIGFIFASPDDVARALIAVGKSPNLTGRETLWAQARLSIQENPMLGVGFGAYWHPVFYDALGMYRALDIRAEAGFHFHNLYYETAAELGYVGVIFMSATILGVLFIALRQFIVRPSNATGFSLGILSLLLPRITLEVEFLSAFSSGYMLLTVCYQFLRMDREASYSGVIGSPEKRPSQFRGDDLLEPYAPRNTDGTLPECTRTGMQRASSRFRGEEFPEASA
jgi:exopolysaccharide production protein ExoQ